MSIIQEVYGIECYIYFQVTPTPGSMGQGRARGSSLGPTPTQVFKSSPRRFTGIEIHNEANMEDYQNVDARLSILESKMANMLSILVQNGFMQASGANGVYTNGASPYCQYKNPGRVSSMRLRPTSTQVFHRDIRYETNMDQNVDARLSVLESQMAKVVSVLRRNGFMQANI